MTPETLIEFEEKVKTAFEAGEIKAPVHLCGGNEEALIHIFKSVKPSDWVFSTHRSHLHALLHGVDPDWLMKEIIEGRSISINCPEKRFYSSAIVGGILPIAMGVSCSIMMKGEPDRVFVFVGDMASETGICAEVTKYAAGHNLALTIVIEDNGFSVKTPTQRVWGKENYGATRITRYSYENTYPHQGSGRWVQFG